MNNENLKILTRNAKVGDGCYWMHPESVHYNLIFTGTNKHWIEYKASLAEGRSSEVTVIRKKNSDIEGVYRNSKQLYHVKIHTNKLFTEYKEKSNMETLSEMTDLDIAMWYLDDGCCIERRDHKNKSGIISYRYSLCIGNFCEESKEKEAMFLNHMLKRFNNISGKNVGKIRANNSKATERNKTWSIPVPIAKYLITLIAGLNIKGFDKKLRFRF